MLMAYRTLEEIRLRKEKIREAIDKENLAIGSSWSSLFVRREETTRGEYLANLVSYGVTVFDAMMTLRKLKRNYGGIMKLISRRK